MGKYNTIGAMAEKLYLEGNTLEAIAQVLEVSLVSLSDWKQKYDWEGKRNKYQRQPQAIADKISGLLYKYLDNLNAETLTTGADAISKICSALNRLGGTEDFPAMAVTVQTRFMEWIEANSQDKEFKTKLFEYLQQFFRAIKTNEYRKVV